MWPGFADLRDAGDKEREINAIEDLRREFCLGLERVGKDRQGWEDFSGGDMEIFHTSFDFIIGVK